SSLFFFFSSRRRHTRFSRDWSSDVCSSDLSGASWPLRPREKEPASRRVPKAPVTGAPVPKAGSGPRPGPSEGPAERPAAPPAPRAGSDQQPGQAGVRAEPPAPEPAGPAPTGESGHRPAPGPTWEPGPIAPEAAATAVAVPAGAAGSPAAGTAGQGPAAAEPGNPAAPEPPWCRFPR